MQRPGIDVPDMCGASICHGGNKKGHGGNGKGGVKSFQKPHESIGWLFGPDASSVARLFRERSRRATIPAGQTIHGLVGSMPMRCVVVWDTVMSQPLSTEGEHNETDSRHLLEKSIGISGDGDMCDHTATPPLCFGSTCIPCFRHPVRCSTAAVVGQTGMQHSLSSFDMAENICLEDV